MFSYVLSEKFFKNESQTIHHQASDWEPLGTSFDVIQFGSCLYTAHLLSACFSKLMLFLWVCLHFLFKRNHNFICFLSKWSCTSAFFIELHHWEPSLPAYFLCLIIFWRKINTQTLSSASEAMSLFTGLSVGSSCISDWLFKSSHLWSLPSSYLSMLLVLRVSDLSVYSITSGL